MKEIEALKEEGEVGRALEEAQRVFQRYGDLKSFKALTSVLITARKINELEKLRLNFPHLFEQDPDAAAVLFSRSLRLKELFSHLHKASHITRAWVLASLGYYEEAGKVLKESNVKRSYIFPYLKIVRGENPGNIHTLDETMKSYLYRDYLTATFLIYSGMLDEGLNMLNSVAFRSFEWGYIGWGIDTLLLKGLVDFNPTEIEAGKYIAAQVGDKLSVKLADVYLTLLRGESPEVLDVPKLKINKELAESVLKGEKLSIREPFAYYSLWWYAEKVLRNKRFLTLAGKARLMEGKKEIHLSRPNRSIAVLVFHKVLGERGKDYSYMIFPKSKNPKRRYEEYLGRLGDLKHVPTDMHITRRYGTFLSHEESMWARFLREMV